jgi:cytochrome c-type biogenesis protein CcmH
MNITRYIKYFFLAAILLNLTFTLYSISNSTDNQVSEISKELMCPVCRGQTVAESNSELANDFRDVIRNKLLEGKSKEEILTYFTSRYGDSVLASPPAKGFRLLIWLLPLVALILGFLLLSSFLKSKSKKIMKVGNTDNMNKEYLEEVDNELSKMD